MHEEKAALQAVGALTIQESLNQVELLQSLQNHQEQLSSRLEDRLQLNLVQALAQYGNMEREEEARLAQLNDPNGAVPRTQVNAVQNTVTDPILTALQNLSTQLAALTTAQQANNGGRNGGGNGGGGNNDPNGGGGQNNNINPRTGRPYRRYCWTHGCCAHWSRNCNNKAQGHKDNATFRNRLGGSNRNCLPTPPNQD